MRDMQMTKNFSRAEFACKGKGCCGGSAPIAAALVELLQAIRDNAGLPITVLSGFRCRLHNERITGAHPDSYHTLGMAADITCTAIDAALLYEICREEIAAAGYGFALLYSSQNFVHIDIRDWQP